MPRKLDPRDIEISLQQLHADWSTNEQADHIQRRFRFDSYLQTVAFANAVAWIAQQENHHPQITIEYHSCLVDYSTHSVDGLSELDFHCAGTIDGLVNH